jgi:Folate receptor family
MAATLRSRRRRSWGMGLVSFLLVLAGIIRPVGVLAACARPVDPSTKNRVGDCGAFPDYRFEAGSCCEVGSALFEDPPDLTQLNALPPCRQLSPGCSFRYKEFMCAYRCSSAQSHWWHNNTLYVCQRSADCFFAACRGDEWTNYSDPDLRSCGIVGRTFASSEEFMGWGGFGSGELKVVPPWEEAAGRSCLSLKGCEVEASIGWAGVAISMLTLCVAWQLRCHAKRHSSLAPTPAAPTREDDIVALSDTSDSGDLWPSETEMFAFSSEENSASTKPSASPASPPGSVPSAESNNSRASVQSVWGWVTRGEKYRGNFSPPKKDTDLCSPCQVENTLF